MVKQKNKKTAAVVVESANIKRYRGITSAAKLLGRSPAQLRRHISGEAPSLKLAEDMDRLGVVVEEL